MISFNNIPASLRVPGAYIEIDGSLAGLNSGAEPALLLIGLKLATGTAPSNEMIFCGSQLDADTLTGAGSMLAQMAKRFYAGNPFLNLYLLPMPENAAGVAATATLTVTTPPTADGTLALYIAGQLISVTLTAAMTAAQVAAAINAAIVAQEALDHNSLPATSAVVGAVVTLTAKHKGVYGNAIDVRINAISTDRTPTGLVLAITAFTGGTLIPANMTANGIATIFDTDVSGYVNTPSKYIALGFNDAASLLAIHTESQRRYQPPIQAGFRSFAALSDSYANLIAFGQTKNYEHISLTALQSGLTSSWEAAAIIAAVASQGLYDNPVKSLEGKALTGLLAGSPFTIQQENALLFAGMSIIRKGRDGSATIKRLISMYLYNSSGSLDDAYLDINTTEAEERIRQSQRFGAIQRFTGKAAAVSDENYRPGLPIVTLDTLRAFLLTHYKNTLMREFGWVQNYEHYKSTLIIEQDPLNPSRFNFIDQPVLLSPFYILAGKSQFKKIAGA